MNRPSDISHFHRHVIRTHVVRHCMLVHWSSINTKTQSNQITYILQFQVSGNLCCYWVFNDNFPTFFNSTIHLLTAAFHNSLYTASVNWLYYREVISIRSHNYLLRDKVNSCNSALYIKKFRVNIFCQPVYKMELSFLPPVDQHSAVYLPVTLMVLKQETHQICIS